MRKDIPEQRKVQLINAAVETIGEVGLSGMTLSQVAKEAGMSTGIVSHYFGDITIVASIPISAFSFSAFCHSRQQGVQPGVWPRSLTTSGYAVASPANGSISARLTYQCQQR